MNKGLVKAYVIVGVIVALIGGWVIYHALSWDYYTSLGPGHGFFPLWIGIILSGLGIILGIANISVLRQDKAKTQKVSSEHLFTTLELKTAGMVTGALVACFFLLNWLGFVLTVSLLSLFLLQIVGRWGWLKSILFSAIFSVGPFWVFKTWLSIPLPVGVLKFFGF